MNPMCTRKYRPRPESPYRGCEEWCRREGLEFSLSTRVAHAILHWLPLPPLPPPQERPDVWEELVQWRYPQLDLNLLQLAIIFGFESAAEKLWTPPFLREKSYTDESSRLVNHPVHLFLTLRPDLFNCPIYIRDEVFLKEGTVDLTSARLRMLLSGTRLVDGSAECPPAQAASAGVSVHQGRAAQENPLELLMRRHTVYDSENVFSNLGTRSDFAFLRQPNFDAICLIMFEFGDKLRTGEARASTVELLWAIVEALSSQGVTLEFYYYTILPLGIRLEEELGEEMLILACQLYYAVSENDTEVLSLDDGIAGTMDTAVKREIDVMRAVRYLPNETILHIIGCFQRSAETAKMLQRSGDSELYSAAAENLRRMLQQRTLQDHSVLSILKAVRGDARKVWSMTDYPEVLRQKFHVPLKGLHRSLQSASQVD